MLKRDYTTAISSAPLLKYRLNTNKLNSKTLSLSEARNILTKGGFRPVAPNALTYVGSAVKYWPSGAMKALLRWSMLEKV